MAEDTYRPGEPHWTDGQEGVVYPGNPDFLTERDNSHLVPRRRLNLGGSLRASELPSAAGFSARGGDRPFAVGIIYSTRGIDPPTLYRDSAERTTLPENGLRHVKELINVQQAGRRIPGRPLPVQNSGIVRDEAGEPIGIDESGLSLPQSAPFPVPPSTGIFTADDDVGDASPPPPAPVFKRGRAKKRAPRPPLSAPGAVQMAPTWSTRQFAAYNAATTDEERAAAMAAITAELAETSAVAGQGPEAVAAKMRREKLAANRADKKKAADEKLAQTNARLPEAQRVDKLPPTRIQPSRKRKMVVRFADELAVSAAPKLSAASAEEVAVVGSALEATLEEAGKPAGKKRAHEEGVGPEEAHRKSQRLRLNGPKAATAQGNMEAESKATTSTNQTPAYEPAAKGQAKAKAAAAPAKQALKRKRTVKAEPAATFTSAADPAPAAKRTRAGGAASAAATAAADSVPAFDNTPADIDAAANAAVIAAAIAPSVVAPPVAPVPAPAAVAAGFFLATSPTITFPDGTTYTDPGKGNRIAPIYISGANQGRQWVKSAVHAPRNGELLEQPCTMATAWMEKKGLYEPTFVGYNQTNGTADPSKPFIKCSWCQAYCKSSKTCSSIR